MSPDTFRKKYKPLKQENADLILLIKQTAEALEEIIKKFNSREISIALTNLEQSIMWATKAIVIIDEQQQKEENVCA